MDNQTKQELMMLVRDTLRDTLEDAEERWLSPSDLCKQFACFSTDWLKRYGHLLPRTKAAYSNRWCYPLHRINRLMLTGKIKNLTI